MNEISVEQRFTLLAKLGEHVNWDSLATEQVQVGIREAHVFAGKEFEAFIRNGFRVSVTDYFRETGELAIQIPALPRPTLEGLQEKYSWVKKIERDTSVAMAATLRLKSVLAADEKNINGGEYEKRIAPKLNVALGYQHAEWLVQHQDEFPELMALLGKVYIDFPGLVVVNAGGSRAFPCLGQRGGRWSVRWGWVGDGFDQDGRVGVSSK